MGDLVKVITEDMSVEDRLNEEVRAVLMQHAAEMERSNMSYTDMFKMLQKKMSREKILRLSPLTLDPLNKDEEIEYYADPQEIRQEIVKMISDEMKTDEAIDALVRPT